MKIFYYFLILLSGLFACQPSGKLEIDKLIKTHGSKNIYSSKISFDFRGIGYTIQKSEDTFNYTRTLTDSLNRTIVDQLTNTGFTRTIDNIEVSVPDTMASKYGESINSVAYFFLLPEPLKDPAVLSFYEGLTKIKGQEYHKVRVKFRKESGGTDHDDQYLYWINKDTKFIDFLAYSYDNSDSGVRFREAINRQEQNGLYYCDYRNFGFEGTDYSIDDLEKLYTLGEIPLLSLIENKNVKIEAL